jgi:hypothetical protein
VRAAVAGAVVLGACTGGHASRPAPEGSGQVPTNPNAPAPSPRDSLKAAVAELLAAEQRGDHASSFRLLDDEGRRTYPDVFRWRDRRNELPAVTGFRISGSGKAPDSLDVVVDHAPGLDPFVGLRPAHERETWTGRREHGGWLVAGDPTSSDPVLPPETGVVPAVMGWVQAAQACDTSTARARQGVEPLLGTGNAATQLCSQKITFTPGAVAKVRPGPATQQLAAQYNADALLWARSVTLTGAARPIDVIVAPIGDAWRVIGVFA